MIDTAIRLLMVNRQPSLHDGQRVERQVHHEKQRAEAPLRQRRPDDRKPRDLSREQRRCIQELHRQRHQRRAHKNALHVFQKGMLLGGGFGQDQHGSILVTHPSRVKR
jgi:hypothetical protein